MAFFEKLLGKRVLRARRHASVERAEERRARARQLLHVVRLGSLFRRVQRSVAHAMHSVLKRTRNDSSSDEDVRRRADVRRRRIGRVVSLVRAARRRGGRVQQRALLRESPKEWRSVVNGHRRRSHAVQRQRRVKRFVDAGRSAVAEGRRGVPQRRRGVTQHVETAWRQGRSLGMARRRKMVAFMIRLAHDCRRKVVGDVGSAVIEKQIGRLL